MIVVGGPSRLLAEHALVSSQKDTFALSPNNFLSRLIGINKLNLKLASDLVNLHFLLLLLALRHV